MNHRPRPTYLSLLCLSLASGLLPLASPAAPPATGTPTSEQATTTGAGIDTAAERASFREALEVPSVWTGQPYIASRIASFGSGVGGSGSAPIRIFVYGDSYSTGFALPPNVASKGDMNLGVLGYADNSSIPGVTRSTTDYATWVSGVTWTHAAASTAELTFGSQSGTGGYVQGDRAYIAYIKQSGGGSFDLEYQSYGGSWTPMGAASGKTFTVDAGTDVFTATAHGYSTGTPIRPSTSSALPGGLTAGVTYFVIGIDANTFKVATTAALATAGTAVNITSTGAGTHTATSYSSIGISGASATTIGAYDTFTLPTANQPFYKLRIINVTTGGFKRISAGIYNSDGGGGLLMHLGNLTGRSPIEYTPNAAILDPIWTGLAPDMVLSCWREGDSPGETVPPGGDESQWFEGGAFDAFYVHTKEVRQETDWVLVGMHPSENEADYPAVTKAEREWALLRDESWFNPYPLFRSYAVASDRGMMAEDDDKHLSAAGHQMRNFALWKNQMLGSYPLGAIGGVSVGNPLFHANGGPGVVGDNTTFSPRSFAIKPNPGNLGELEIWDKEHRLERNYAFRLRAQENSLFFNVQNFDVAEIGFRYFKPLYGVAYNKTLRTATFNHWHWEYLSVCDATSGAITAQIAHSASQSGAADGRVHVFKKLDSSANAVTVTSYNITRHTAGTTSGSPNITFASNGTAPPVGQVVTGTGIPADTTIVSSTATTAVLSQNATATGSGLVLTFYEPIEGKATKVLANQYDYVALQSHNGGWLVVGGNL